MIILLIISLFLLLYANHKVETGYMDAFRELMDEGVEVIDEGEFFERFPHLVLWTAIKWACIVFQAGALILGISRFI